MAEVRLQVHLSRAGVLSRRRAEVAIADGRVAVNGEVVTQMGSKVNPELDEVTLDGERVGAPQHPATIMLHKPDGVMSTLDDPENRETVSDIVRGEPFHFVPVGRLDYHTEGLLLLSTDGMLIHRLLHPSFHVSKGYRVKTSGKMSDASVDRLRDGIELEDGVTRPALVEVVERTPRTTWLEILVSEGRNRLVRRMVEAVGHSARRVVRLEFATLHLGDLKPGQYRYLTPAELDALYRTAQLPAKSPPPRYAEVGPAPIGTPRRGRGKLPGIDVAVGRTERRKERTAPADMEKKKPAGRRRLAVKGRAKPPDAPPLEDHELGLAPAPPAPRLRPDGVPKGRPPGYPDTRVWRRGVTLDKYEDPPEPATDSSADDPRGSRGPSDRGRDRDRDPRRSKGSKGERGGRGHGGGRTPR